eukprot:CCRYP_011900-RA/>CCRYP_011900-RA protein AED:0.20 eAED:-0.11 QI:0/0/0/1/1/1/3/0/1923
MVSSPPPPTPPPPPAATNLPFSSWGSDLPFNTKATHPCGVVSFSRVDDDGETRTHHVWCVDKALWPRAKQYYDSLSCHSYQFTPMSAPDGWTRKYPQALLEAQAINHETFPDDAPDISRGSSALPTPPRRQTRQPDPDPIIPPTTTTAPGTTAPPASTPPDATAALLQSILLQQQQQQQLHNETIRTFMDEIGRMSTTTTTSPAPTPIKPPIFPAYTKDTPLDIFTAQVTTFKQHEYFDGCTWDAKAPGKDKESTYLRSELLRVLPLDLQRLFTNDSRYDNDGFLMLTCLLEHLRPLSHQSKFLTMMEFANLAKGDNESEASLISRAKGIDNILSGVSIAECMPLKILSCLSDSYPGLIARYCQGDPLVVNATVTQLEALMASEREAQRAFPNLYPSSSANRARALPSSSSPPSTTTVVYPLPRGAPWEKVEDLISSGTIFPVCHSRGKWHVNDGSFRCVPLARQGKIIVHDQEAADKIIADYDTHTKQQHVSTGRNNSNRGRGRGRGRTTRPNASANPASTNSPTTAPSPTPSPAPPPPPAPQARRATSVEPPLTTPTPPPNRYNVLDKEMDSDSADDAAYDDADFALADNSNTDYLYPVSACRAHASPPASSSFVSSALNSSANQHLTSHASTIAHPVSTSTQAIADSGATDNMFPDYSAFLSYHRQSNRFVTLGDNTKLPILGIGSAKVKLNGKVVLLRNCLHVPHLRNPLYSLRQHRRMPGCGTYSDYEHGAYILFPRFTLRIDDTTDNIISYEPLGNSCPNIKIDYCQHRHYTPPAARPAAHLSIQYIIPVPKCGRTAAPPRPLSIRSTTPPTDPATVSTESLHIPDKDLLTTTSTPLPIRLLKSIHHDTSNLPSIPPYATPSATESRTTFDTLKLHRIFGCRRFRNQEHITSASLNAKLIKTGDFPPTIGDFATLTNPPRGKPLTRRRQFLDKVHMDIVFGDCLSLGGYKYALLLVDVATRYSWIFGLQSLTGTAITDALDSFVSEAGSVPRTFHADFDKKLIGGSALRWIHSHQSRVQAAPASRQSSNGLVEATWKTIVKMARAYLTEKQMTHEFWFYAVKHATRMMNYIPGRMGRRLASPFELVHGVKPDSTTWFELFSVGFFKMESSSAGKHSKTQSMSLAGIAVGRDDTSNTILFYNPVTRSYYRPQAFTLDEARLPLAQWPGLIIPDDVPIKGTITNIPTPSTSPLLQTAAHTSDSSLPDSSSLSPSRYTILLDNGTTTECDFEELAPSEQKQLHPPSSSFPNPFRSLPSWLQQDSKVTLDCRGAFHKGYLHYCPVQGFLFVVKRTAKSAKIDWTEPLHDLPQHWTTLCADNTLLPGHNTISSFLKPNSSNNAPSAHFVSAKNLLHPCPPSLVKALHPSNPDRDIWLRSYNEEKGGLESMQVFERINKKQYLLLKRSGRIGKALPSMCVLVVKTDKDGKPNRAKSRIVVLGNFEDRIYDKSQKYAPVLKYTSLRLLTSKAVSDKRVLQQGDCKNAFCQAYLPEDELTVVRPPVGDPAYSRDEYWLLKKTLYGLRRSPHHWFHKITSILKDMGLRPSPHDPCLYTGVLHDDAATSSRPPSPTSVLGISPPVSLSKRQPVHVGLYVDDFVFYSACDEEQQRFQRILASKIKVDFMGDVDYFLGTAFTWKRHTNGELSAFLSQTAFTEYMAHRFAVDNMTPVPNMTPYRSGLPIDAIPPPDPKDPDLTRRTKCYQSMVGCINCRAGGPIAWKSIRQQQTARSSCEAEILATDACVAELLHIRHCAQDLGISDASQRIVVYNDNKAAVNWADAMTSKGTKHLNLHENCVREAHHNHVVKITHIPGIINSSDLFTKELKDAAHFRRCRDSMMVSRSNFLQHQHCVPSHMTAPHSLPYYSIRSGQTPAHFAVKHGASRHAVAQSVSNGPTDILPERGVLVDSDRPVWLPRGFSSLGAL